MLKNTKGTELHPLFAKLKHYEESEDVIVNLSDILFFYVYKGKLCIQTKDKQMIPFSVEEAKGQGLLSCNESGTEWKLHIPIPFMRLTMTEITNSYYIHGAVITNFPFYVNLYSVLKFCYDRSKEQGFVHFIHNIFIDVLENDAQIYDAIDSIYKVDKKYE